MAAGSHAVAGYGDRVGRSIRIPGSLYSRLLESVRRFPQLVPAHGRELLSPPGAEWLSFPRARSLLKRRHHGPLRLFRRERLLADIAVTAIRQGLDGRATRSPAD